MHKAYGRTVGTVLLKIESVDKLQSQHVKLLYDHKHNSLFIIVLASLLKEQSTLVNIN